MASSADYTIKQHDHGTTIVITLQEQNPVTEEWSDMNLTAVDVAKLLLKASGTGVISGVADVTDAANGEVTYTWDADDLQAAGTYEAEVQLTYNDDSVETVPNDGYFSVEVVADLNAGD